jgi:osmotically-inducible protein OsmY
VGGGLGSSCYEVAAGIFSLVGTVTSYAEKLAAQSAAQAVHGVHDVVNDVDVKPPSGQAPSDNELEEMAKKVLAWDALVPDQSLEVTVSDGWVTITGEVAVAAQGDEAERVISRLTGVRAVTNRITIHPPDVTPETVRGAVENALHRRAAHRAARIDISVDRSTVSLEGLTQSGRRRERFWEPSAMGPGS